MPKNKILNYVPKDGFLLMSKRMFDSPAFRSLSSSSIIVYLLLVRRFNGYNNGEIALSCRDCAKYAKISRNTAQRAFFELQEKGFIKLEKQGLFTTKNASTYTLTSTVNSGTILSQPTNDWMRWGSGSN